MQVGAITPTSRGIFVVQFICFHGCFHFRYVIFHSIFFCRAEFELYILSSYRRAQKKKHRTSRDRARQRLIRIEDN